MTKQLDKARYTRSANGENQYILLYKHTIKRITGSLRQQNASEKSVIFHIKSWEKYLVIKM